MAQVVGCLPSKRKALNSNPNTTKKEKKEKKKKEDTFSLKNKSNGGCTLLAGIQL
jgi:hypothetical protein